MTLGNTIPIPKQVQCIEENLGIVTVDGEPTQVRLFKHSDGFSCLRFTEVDEDGAGTDPDQDEDAAF